jgi:PAS domain S-box-containing protein
MTIQRVLVIDDEVAILSLCERILGREGFHVTSAPSAEEGLRLAGSERWDLALVDVRLPDGDGLDILTRMREDGLETLVILMTGHATMEIAIDALKSGAQDFLLKPFAPQELVASVHRVLERERLLRENVRLRARLPILEISKALMSETDPARLTDLALEGVQRELRADRVSLMLLDEGRQELYVSATRGPGEMPTGDSRVKVGEGIAGLAVQRRTPLLVPNPGQPDLDVRAMDLCTSLGSAISVPLLLQNRVLGVLNVCRTQSTEPFRQDDVDLLSILCGQIAVAMENARLFKRAQLEIAERERAEGALEKERSFVSAILDTVGALVVVLDREGRIVRLNQACERTTGYSFAEASGQHVWDLFLVPEEVDPVKAVFGELRSGQFPTQYENYWLTRGGKRRLIAWTNTALVDDEGVVEYVIGTGVDVTERRRAEEALRESEARYRELFEEAPLCIFELDLMQEPPVILRANRQGTRVYGWSGAEFASLSPNTIIPPMAVSDLASIVDALRAGQALTVESVNRRRDGTLFPVRISAAAGPETDLSRVIVLVEDITIERERRSEEEAIAEERQRIAREIHDGLAQDLASLRVRIGLWHDLVDHDPEQMHAELDAMESLLRQNIRDVRRSIFALRPLSLDELGFYPAIRRFAREFGEQSQLHIDLQVVGPQDRLPSHLEPVLFRIIQEALHNVGKHARASAIWVELDVAPPADTVRLAIRDDGAGFDPRTLDHAFQQGHVGLTHMHERVAKLGGKLGIESQVGHGTTIRVSLPINETQGGQ